jgi:hypothetical protein
MEICEQLQRTGYGSNFNTIYITKDTIIKESKNEYGHKKLKKEILFYLFLDKHNISFPRPKILSFTQRSYTMEFLKDSVPLYTVFSSFTTNKQEEIIEKIKNHLKDLHKNHIEVSKETFMECLQQEFYTKLIERFQQTEQILGEFFLIQSVNQKQFPFLEKGESSTSLAYFTKIIEKIYTEIQNKYVKEDSYTFSVIHGDCQFNNILYNENSEELVFIDPRGYFGSSDIYGMADYDFAKVQFALSGYDQFDNMEINHLEDFKGNLDLPLLFQIPDPLPKDNPITLFTLAIWLGNAHVFSQNMYKCAFSYFYALHLITLYFENQE